jgi:hypothetical protein
MKSDRSFLIFLGIILLFLLLLRLPTFSEPLGLDQGLFSSIASGILKGQLPYRDLWDHKPPAVFYIYAAAFKLLGAQVSSVAFLEYVVVLLITAFLAFTGKILWGPRPGLIAAALFGLFSLSSFFEGFWGRSQAEVLFSLFIIIGIFILFRFPPQGALFPLLAGIFLGLAFTVKFSALLNFAPVASVIVIRKLSHNWRKKIITLLYIALGCSLVPLGAGLYFWFQGAGKEFYWSVITFNKYYAQLASHQGLGGRILWTTLGFAHKTALLWGLALLGLVLMGSTKERAHLVIFSLWLFHAFLSVWLQDKFYGYHFYPILLPLVLIATRGAEGLLTWAQARSWRWLPASLLIIAGLVFWGWDYIKFNRENIKYIAGQEKIITHWRSFDQGPISFARNYKLADYLRRRSSPQDAILVWALAPDLPFLSERPSASKYLLHHYLLTPSAPMSQLLPGLAERQKNFMEEVQRKNPRFILVGTRDINGYEPKDSYAQMQEFPAFYQWVEKNYSLESPFEDLLIYKRKE